jgi:KilA-N domain
MAKTSLASHQFKEHQITQISEDTVIGGVLIPKGYCNATEICKANGKRWVKYTEYSKTQEYLTLLRESFSGTDLIITISASVNELRGTWVHHLIALDLAAWLSPEFKLWANKTLWHVINDNFQALTPEAEEAKKQLQLIWNEIRQAGIVTRKSLTSVIKTWYENNPGVTSRPTHNMYSETTNHIYQALWNLDAKGLEAILDCDRHDARNHMDANSLKLLERAEANVMDYIEEDNIKPVDAVNLANIRTAKTLPTKLGE